MAYVYRHWQIDGEQVRRIESDPDAAVEPVDIAILEYLTLPEDKRRYALGRFTMGRFDTELGSGEPGDCLHTGSIFKTDFQELARGKVIEDNINPDGIYEVYVPI